MKKTPEQYIEDNIDILEDYFFKTYHGDKDSFEKQFEIWLEKMGTDDLVAMIKYYIKQKPDMKKQTVDSISKPKLKIPKSVSKPLKLKPFFTKEEVEMANEILGDCSKYSITEDTHPHYAHLQYQLKLIDDLDKERKQVELRKLAQQIFADQLEREKEDKLWLLFAKGLALFIVGYMAYHFIRFLMM